LINLLLNSKHRSSNEGNLSFLNASKYSTGIICKQIKKFEHQDWTELLLLIRLLYWLFLVAVLGRPTLVIHSSALLPSFFFFASASTKSWTTNPFFLSIQWLKDEFFLELSLTDWLGSSAWETDAKGGDLVADRVLTSLLALEMLNQAFHFFLPTKAASACCWRSRMVYLHLGNSQAPIGHEAFLVIRYCVSGLWSTSLAETKSVREEARGRSLRFLRIELHDSPSEGVLLQLQFTMALRFRSDTFPDMAFRTISLFCVWMPIGEWEWNILRWRWFPFSFVLLVSKMAVSLQWNCIVRESQFAYGALHSSSMDCFWEPSSLGSHTKDEGRDLTSQQRHHSQSHFQNPVGGDWMSSVHHWITILWLSHIFIANVFFVMIMMVFSQDWSVRRIVSHQPRGQSIASAFVVIYRPSYDK